MAVFTIWWEKMVYLVELHQDLSIRVSKRRQPKIEQLLSDKKSEKTLVNITFGTHTSAQYRSIFAVATVWWEVYRFQVGLRPEKSTCVSKEWQRRAE
jgi:hypothetical protein